MNEKLKEKIKIEFKLAKDELKGGNLSNSFNRFERVHILGQRSLYWHTAAHVYMLRIAVAKRDFFETFGQIIRIPLGIIGSFIGVVPIGNTGGSNVGLFKKMSIPDDLNEFLK